MLDGLIIQHFKGTKSVKPNFLLVPQLEAFALPG